MSGTAAVMGVIDQAIADATLSRGEHVEFVLVRHGKPADHAPGAPDPSLGDLGRRQAEAAAGYLARCGPVEAVYSSALARAHETARIIGAALGRGVQVQPALREIELYRDDVADESVWRAAADGFAEHGRWESFPLPAAGLGFRTRVRGAVDELAGRHSRGPIVVVCHSGVVNAVLADVLGLERDYLVRPAHASISRIRRGAGRWALHTVNETPHLPPSLLTT